MLRVVKAIDGDRGINNKISYAITRGGAGIFGIDSNTGIVYNLRPLDREDPRNSNGAFILEITVSSALIANTLNLLIFIPIVDFYERTRPCVEYQIARKRELLRNLISQ